MANGTVSLKESYCLTGIRYIWMPWNYVDDTCHGQHSVAKSRKKYAQFRVWDNVPEGITLIFGDKIPL